MISWILEAMSVQSVDITSRMIGVQKNLNTLPEYKVKVRVIGNASPRSSKGLFRNTIPLKKLL